MTSTDTASTATDTASTDTASTDTASTDTDVLAVVDRYVATWNEPDGDRRAELARALWADDGRLTDPLLDAVGPDAVAAAIGGLRDQMPGHGLVRVSDVDAHHDLARFAWEVRSPEGAAVLAGVDVVTLAPDGRLRTAASFFGDLAPVGDSPAVTDR